MPDALMSYDGRCFCSSLFRSVVSQRRSSVARFSPINLPPRRHFSANTFKKMTFRLSAAYLLVNLRTIIQMTGFYAFAFTPKRIQSIFIL